MSLLLTAWGFYGTWIIWRRFRPGLLQKNNFELLDQNLPKLSIIVPARNEEHNIAHLLTSLKKVQYPNLEIIVANDGSTDRTGSIAREYDVRVIDVPLKPQRWGGKQWACQQGAHAATGELLLFTDADTIHLPDGPRTAVIHLLRSKAEMLSTLPYHQCQTRWENLLGPFHLLLLTVTRPFEVPEWGRVFAIGQYLLFTRSGYERIGGHEEVKSSLVEDLPMANLAVQKHLNYTVFNGDPLYNVRMYSSFQEFIKGWRRNFRAGFKYGHWRQSLEIVGMMIASTALINGLVYQDSLNFSLGIVTTATLASRQHRLGNFSVSGALFPYFAITTFIWISLVALMDSILERPVQWKAREYEA